MTWQPHYGPSWLPDGRVRFRIWSPGSELAEVVFEDGAPLRLRRNQRGEHSASSRDRLRPGLRYRVQLDGEGPFPDPWSRWQPDGVHGPSALLPALPTAATHRSVPRGRAQTAYELHLGTFTPEGTYRAAAGRLRHLQNLGVDTVQVMPLAEFPGRWNWGYDGVCLYAPTRAYGSPADLLALVAAAHRRGLAIILDAVYNHFGPDGAYIHRFAPEFFDAQVRTPWGGAIDYSREQVRRTVADAARWWLERYGFDGLRLDATHAIRDGSPRHILADIAAAARRAYPGAYVVAEDERKLPELVTRYRLDAKLSDDFHHSLRVSLTGERDAYFARYQGGEGELAESIEQGWLGSDPRLPAERFVFCIENHDQVGNRAHGLHLSGLVSPAAFRAAVTLLLLVPERALLFQGQEWATAGRFLFFTDHEPSLGRKVTEGRRQEFNRFPEFREHPERIPDPQRRQTFERSKLDWTEPARNGWALRLHRELLGLRRHDPVLSRPDLGGLVTFVEDGLLHLERRAGGQRRRLLVTLRGSHVAGKPEGRVLLHSEERRFGGSGRISLGGPIAILLSP